MKKLADYDPAALDTTHLLNIWFLIMSSSHTLTEYREATPVERALFYKAIRHQRAFVGIELVKKSAALARRRILNDAPLLNHVAAEPAAIRELRQIDMFPKEDPAEKPPAPDSPMVN